MSYKKCKECNKRKHSKNVLANGVCRACTSGVDPHWRPKKANQPANRKKWADKTFDELNLTPSDY